jgi:hypothetical protein
MKIKPIENFRFLGTSCVLDKRKTYHATRATNQPDWKVRGAIFVTVQGASLLLERGEYIVIK